VKPTLRQIINRLLDHYGPRHWWPADTPFEVMVGAILTQNTAWTNVEKAIGNLKSRGLLDPQGLADASNQEIVELIRPAGYFNQKAKKLKIMVGWLLNTCGGDIEKLKKRDPEELRKEVLGLWGIGPETADSILCYAVGLPIFVVDAYTIRVLSRHGLVAPDASYDVVQALTHQELPLDNSYLNEAHALFVAVGKEFCKRKNPICAQCPLKEYISL